MTEVRAEQPEKTAAPILITELGIITEVRPEQPEKADSPILVTELGITVFFDPAIKVFDCVSMIALQSFLLSYFLFPCSTIIELIPEHLKKAPWPILVTELGIETDVRPEQSEIILNIDNQQLAY